MIIEVQMFTVECDNCHKISGQNSEYSCWGERAIALEDASESGWIALDGKDYCPDCYYINDEDEITIKTI